MTNPVARLAEVRSSIDRACKIAGRKPDDVTLIAVSKGRSAEAIEQLIAAGQRHFGESRVQEAADKWPVLRHRYPDISLHMIGRLQSNKAEEAAWLFDWVHSLDRRSLIDSLATVAVKLGRAPHCFVQVNIGAEEQKGGVAIAELGGLLEAVHSSSLPLAGLMAIPPEGAQASPYFALLAELGRRHGVTGLSMGMSADFPQAVMLGATHVRVGTALFED